MIDDLAFQELVKQWESLKDRQEAARFYEEHVIPQARKQVVAREQQRHTPYEGLIMTVGLFPEPLILSILSLKPQKVYFLYTRASEKYLVDIFEQTGLKINQIEKDEIDETNLPDIYRKVKDIREKWSSFERIAVDITGGKKSMVGGCALAGTFIGADILYMDSQTSPERKPIPGSEHIVLLENPYNVFGDLEFRRAQSLYEKLDFASAAGLLDGLEKKTSTPEAYAARACLCQAYAAWDDWKIGEALVKLKQCVEWVNNYRRSNKSTPLVGLLPELNAQIDLLERLDQALKLNDTDEMTLLNSPHLYQPMIGTLYHGALRQEKRSKEDVAALLWYRLIELLSQRRLAAYGLSTSDPDYTKLNLAEEELRSAMADTAATIDKNMDKSAYQLPKDLSLLNGYLLLMALKDPLVAHFHLGKIRSQIKARNGGIFAHGFKPLNKEDYNDFKSFADKIAQFFRGIEQQNIEDWETCEFIVQI